MTLMDVQTHGYLLIWAANAWYFTLTVGSMTVVGVELTRASGLFLSSSNEVWVSRTTLSVLRLVRSTGFKVNYRVY